VFDLRFFDPDEQPGPFVSGLDTSDDTPPAQPTVILGDTITSVSQELYAQWYSGDPQSGIRRYEYAIGTHSAPEGAGEQDAGQQDAGEEDAGDQEGDGFYIAGFGGALEAANQMAGIIGGEPAGPGIMDSGLTDVVSWTDAGGRTEAIIKNLDLQHGHEYVVSVRATNGAGLQSTGSSQPILVDLTPPEGIQIVEFVQQEADGHPNSVKFEFTFGEDPETAVAAHYFALGTSETTDDLFPWTEAELDFGRIADLPVSAGTPIYLLVKGVNALGLETVITAELQLSFPDASPPPPPMVVTQPTQSSTDGSELSIGWNGVQDAESGITGYAYAISSRVPEDPEVQPDILDWVPVERTEQPYYIGKRVGGGEDMVLPGVGGNDAGGAGGEGGGVVVGIAGGGFGYVQAGFQVMDEILGTDYEVQRGDLALSGEVVALVKVTNGAGQSSVSASPMIVFDASAPEIASVQAEPRQSNLQLLELELTAADRESGIQAYRYEVYRILQAPNMAWASSPWRNAWAAPGEELVSTIQITGFPAPGLQYNTMYEVRIWVRNRAGLARAAGPVTVEVVPLQEEGEDQADADAEGVIDIRREPELPGVRRNR
jgi:hypothetical protein